MSEWRKLADGARWQLNTDTPNPSLVKRKYEETILLMDKAFTAIKKEGINPTVIRAQAGLIAIQLRKLVLERLLTQRFKGVKLHALKYSESSGFKIDLYSDREKTKPVPLYYENKPVPGWHVGSNRIHHIDSYQFFDLLKKPELKFGRWKNQSVVNLIDGGTEIKFSIEDCIRLLANKEGAHCDMRGENLLETKGKRLSWSVDGPTFSYLHFAIISIGMYLYNSQLCKEGDPEIVVVTEKYARFRGRIQDRENMGTLPYIFYSNR